MAATVTLRPLTDDEYRNWYDQSVIAYGKQHAATGYMTEEEAAAMARREFRQLLPEGRASKDQYLYAITDPADPEYVGVIWFAERGSEQVRQAFVYDIVVWPEHRGKGYGKAAMLAVEEKVREVGLRKIGLHVFGSNETAISLYRAIGYATTDLLMSKELK